MTICPCCGHKSDATMKSGCKACGARPVGEPLPRPENELPSYGRSLLLAVTGTLMSLVFLSQTFMALTERSSRGAKSNLAFLSMVPLDFWSWIAAAETAAWRLKWVMLPATIFVLYFGRKLYRSIRQSPASFCGARHARAGLLASATVPLLMLILIGITVPERLRHRQDGIDAGVNVTGRTFDRAVLEYRLKYQRVPTEPNDLRQLPDADGSIAAALQNLDPSGYEPRAEIAAKQKPQPLRGAVIRDASLNILAEDTLNEGLSFQNYKLRLPGADKLLGTADDLLVNDGVITKASEAAPSGAANSATKARQP